MREGTATPVKPIAETIALRDPKWNNLTSELEGGNPMLVGKSRERRGSNCNGWRRCSVDETPARHESKGFLKPLRHPRLRGLEVSIKCQTDFPVCSHQLSDRVVQMLSILSQIIDDVRVAGNSDSNSV